MSLDGSGPTGASATTTDSARDACLVEVASSSDEWSRVCDLVSRESQPHLKHYGFSLEIAKLHLVSPGCLQRQQQQRAKALGAPTLLFHGTWSDNVQGILREGFALPQRSGMFGPGIYFADCPLKSVQFAKKVGPGRTWLHSLQRQWHRAVGWLSRPPEQRQTLTMLACEVFLGRSWTLRHAKAVNPSEDLRCGWLMKALGAGDYSSVYVPGGLFGAVRVPEYVVYEPYQAIPKYVIEFTVKHIQAS